MQLAIYPGYASSSKAVISVAEGSAAFNAINFGEDVALDTTRNNKKDPGVQSYNFVFMA